LGRGVRIVLGRRDLLVVELESSVSLASSGESMVVTLRLMGSSHTGVVSSLSGMVLGLDGVSNSVMRVGGLGVSSSSTSVCVGGDLVLVTCNSMARFAVDMAISEAT